MPASIAGNSSRLSRPPGRFKPRKAAAGHVLQRAQSEVAARELDRPLIQVRRLRALADPFEAFAQTVGGRYTLFDRNRLRQITWLVHIRAARERRVIREQL